MALGKNFHFWTTFLVATEAALCVTLGEIGTQKCLALCVTVATIQFGSVVDEDDIPAPHAVFPRLAENASHHRRYAFSPFLAISTLL